MLTPLVDCSSHIKVENELKMVQVVALMGRLNVQETRKLERHGAHPRQKS